MAGSSMSSGFVVVGILLVITSFSFAISEARPLKDVESHGSITETLFDRIYVEGIKTGGPSSGGSGHKYPNAQILGGIKHAGPSPGQGNRYTNNNAPQTNERHHYTSSAPTKSALGEIKHAGPSPGIGNRHTSTSSPPGKNSVLGQIKHAGPSPGQGNRDTNAAPSKSALEEIKQSGPSPGKGHKLIN